MFEQNTEAWFQAKCGLLTASEFHHLLTKARSKKELYSAGFRSLLYKKAGEVLTGQIKQISAKAMDHGIEYEPEAISNYEFIEGVEIERVPIVIDIKNNLVGASPDGLVGDLGMIEVKCPFDTTKQIERVLSGGVPTEYLPQIQGNLMVNGREWCDFISYCPDMNNQNRMFIKRVYRDEDYISRLRTRTSFFTLLLEGALYDLGYHNYKRDKVKQLKTLGLL